MADHNHLTIIEKGVFHWNKWRAENPDIIPDLSGVNLRGIDLNSANLIEVDFIQTDLRSATFNDADLTGANLTKANLIEATLIKSDLTATNLSFANLSYADLSGANLSIANFANSNLSNASLIKSNLSGTIFSATNLKETNLSISLIVSTILVDVDLSTARGLETITHFGPSHVGIDTIFRSNGNIPLVFLRGCGVPESYITFITSQLEKRIPFQYYSCFISYSTKDQIFVEKFYKDLQTRGIRCWFAPIDLRIGDEFRTKIDEAIKDHDKILLVLSENSINSTWVQKEVETAMDLENRSKRKLLFPIRLDDRVMETDKAWAADIRRTRQIGDLSGWKDQALYETVFSRLLRDLKADDSPFVPLMSVEL